MTLADTPFISPIQRAHSGGYFWTVNRARRINAILDVASSVQKLVIIAGSQGEARDLSERLTLRGLPTLLAASSGTRHSLATFEAATRSALVTTAEYVQRFGPVGAPITIHLRLPFSARNYVRRLRSSLSAVHLSFVTPEDEPRASTLRSALCPDHDSSADEGVDLEEVIDLTAGQSVAVVEPGRRRFVFRSENSQ